METWFIKKNSWCALGSYLIIRKNADGLDPKSLDDLNHELFSGII